MQCFREIPSNTHKTDRGMELSAQFKIIVFNCSYTTYYFVVKCFIYSELEACERRSRDRGQMVSAICLFLKFELSNFLERNIAIIGSLCCSDFWEVYFSYFWMFTSCLIIKLLNFRSFFRTAPPGYLPVRAIPFPFY